MKGKEYCREKVGAPIHQCREQRRPCVVRSSENCPMCRYMHTLESCSGAGASSSWTTEQIGAGRVR
jgi:hypothetical protein